MDRPIAGRRLNELLAQGAIGGVVAGIVFAIFEMVAMALMGAPVQAPLRMIGAIPLGADSLSPAYPAETAIVVGAVTHLILSAIFGVVFALIVAALPQLAASAATLVVAASIYGFLLWIVNFQIIGRLLFPWFLMADQLIAGFIAHTFFYGSVLGAYLASVLQPGRRAV
ncbi:MAG: hypothetical protein HY331_15765 [Chloroflexi bacterium]|nr:hypothetical protein [Chloroflexota bacterium]